MGKIKLAVVGCGNAGMNHIEAIVKTKGVELVAVADTREELAKQAAGMFKVSYDTDYSRLFCEQELDAVAVITPAQVHYPIAKLALEQGMHVLCEKPLTVEPKESFKLAELAKSKSKILAVTFTYRFVPDTRRIKEIIDGDLIGRIVELRFLSLSGKLEKYPEGTERRRHDDWQYQGRGHIFDCGCHAFDLFMWYAGSKISKIDARGTCHLGYGYPDSATAILEHENGIKSVYDHGKFPYYDSKKPSRVLLHLLVTGEKGSIVWKLGEKDCFGNIKSLLAIYTGDGQQEEWFPTYGKERKKQYEVFADSIKRGELLDPFPSPEHSALVTKTTSDIVDKCLENLIAYPSEPAHQQ